MAPQKTYTWLTVWFIISYAVSLWDVGYILLRPYSFPEGNLRWIWNAYTDLEFIDKTYAIDGFYEGHLKSINLAAKATLTIPEVGLAILYVYQAHISKSPLAPLSGFTAALATLIKCALWILEEVYCGWCTVGHNSPWVIFSVWTIPMGVYIGFSLLSIWRLGVDMAKGLNKGSGKNANEKQTGKS